MSYYATQNSIILDKSVIVKAFGENKDNNPYFKFVNSILSINSVNAVDVFLGLDQVESDIKADYEDALKNLNNPESLERYRNWFQKLLQLQMVLSVDGNPQAELSAYLDDLMERKLKSKELIYLSRAYYNRNSPSEKSVIIWSENNRENFNLSFSAIRYLSRTLNIDFFDPGEDDGDKYLQDMLNQSNEDYEPHVTMRLNFEDHFNLDELKAVCFDLKINYERFNQTNLIVFTLDLLQHCQQKRRSEELLKICKSRIAKPNLPWPENF